MSEIPLAMNDGTKRMRASSFVHPSDQVVFSSFLRFAFENIMFLMSLYPSTLSFGPNFVTLSVPTLYVLEKKISREF